MKILAFSALILALFLPALSGAQPPNGQQRKAASALATIQQAFVENKGQWDPRIKFLMQSGSMNLWLTKDGAVFGVKKHLGKKWQMSDVAMRFAGGMKASLSGAELEPGYFNYLMGKDKSKWATFVRRYAEVDTQPIYKGISARYYFDQGNLRYDLLVEPGADPTKIAMKFEGAQRVMLTKYGGLKIVTKSGTFEEHGLLAYQREHGHVIKVACRMDSERGCACFRLGAYDHARPLVIDPLLGSTYYYTSIANPSISTDGNGNIVVASSWEGPDGTFPTSAGAYQTSTSAFEATYVAKLKADFSGLYFATFLAGSSDGNSGQFSRPIDVKVLSNGSCLVTGNTNEQDFPTTAGAITASQGSNPNCFITDINWQGTGLNFSGTIGPAELTAFALDSAGDIYIAGSALNGFPTSPNAASSGWLDGSGFITEISPACQSVIFSTFIQGTKYPLNSYYVTNPIYVTQMAVDSNRNVYIAGYTIPNSTVDSGPFPATPGALFTSGLGFLLEYGAGGEKLLAATDLPNTGDSYFVCVSLDAQDEPFVGLQTSTSGLPTSTSALETTLAHDTGSYVAGFTSGFKGITSATYLSEIDLDGMTIDSSGNFDIFATADAASPTTQYALERSFDDWDVLYTGYLAVLSGDLSKLQYGSFLAGWIPMLGGGAYGRPSADFLADGSGNVYLVGEAKGGNPTPFFVTNGAYLQSPGSSSTAASADFVAKLSTNPGLLVTFSPNIVYDGYSTNCTVSIPSPAPSGGVAVSLQGKGITTPASVTIPSGASSFTFLVQAGPPQPFFNRMIAEADGQTQVAFIKMIEPQISVTFTPNPVLAGASTVLSATINHPAPAAGTQYSADVNSQGSTLTFGAGQTSAKETIKVNSASAAGTESAIFYAPDGTVYTFPLKVTTSVVPVSFSVNRPTVTSGTAVLGTITLDGGAKSPGQVVTLTSSNSAAASLPASETVATGGTVLQPVISTFGVSTSTQVTLTASANGTSATATMTVLPASLLAVSSQATSIAEGSGCTGTVSLSGLAPSGGGQVTLASSNASALAVPSTCTVAAQTSSETFPIATGSVGANTAVTIRATYAGVTQTASVTVTPLAGPKSLTVAYSQILGGDSMTGTITLSKSVSSATAVTVTTSTSAASIPTSVTVPAGSSSAVFTVKTIGLAAIKPVTLTATLNGGTRTASFSIYPAVLVSLTPAASSVTSGQSVNCTIQLAGNAPTGGGMVSLASSNTSAATVPATVSIASQGTKAVFTITAGSVSTATQVTISATFNGVTKTAIVTVNP